MDARFSNGKLDNYISIYINNGISKAETTRMIPIARMCLGLGNIFLASHLVSKATCDAPTERI